MIGTTLDNIEQFKRYRERMNKRILSTKNLNIKRFFALDTRAYEKGALDAKTKEILGLVASTVLRCNDCIAYHVIRCTQQGITDEEFFEAMNIALIVGGSITIPHIRKATETLDQCRTKKKKEKKG
jgi:AhpD family alkylhydroperoxidase